MKQIISISEWNERYEQPVRTYRAGNKRVSPLAHICFPCKGRQQGPGYRQLLKMTGARAPEVFGVFCKFLELAGDEWGNRRNGVLYNEHGKPATVEELVWLTGFGQESLDYAVGVLSAPKLGWLTLKAEEISGPEKMIKEVAMKCWSEKNAG